eukprot:4097122-Pyramimonas_sp.AAC.1
MATSRRQPLATSVAPTTSVALATPGGPALPVARAEKIWSSRKQRWAIGAGRARDISRASVV